jgi:hypothetical protein
VVASGWREWKTAASGQPEGPQGVEARPAHSEAGGGIVWGQVAVVESGEGGLDDGEGQTVEQLFVCTLPLKARSARVGER